MTTYAARVVTQHLGVCHCGKQRFTTRAAARKQRAADGRRMRAYKCGSYWHATSQSASRAANYRAYAAQSEPQPVTATAAGEGMHRAPQRLTGGPGAMMTP